MGTTLQLAASVCDMSSNDVPQDVIDTAKACLLDTMAVILAGANSDTVVILDDLVAASGSRPQATVLGRGRRVSVADAAWLNGACAHALDFDDMHIESAMHPSSPIITAALATAEATGATGRDFLTAVVLGMEGALRIGNAVNPSHYRRGWHATGTLGHFGAAMAAGRLLRLPPVRLAMAMGIAGTQASGLKGVFGTMTKPLHAGNAARNGVLAAYLAQRGFTCSTDILEGPVGFGEVMSDSPDWARVPNEWAQTWELRNVLYKVHASSFCTQALIEASLQLRRDHGIQPGDVVAIRGYVSRFSVENARVEHPVTGMEAKFSLSHAIAQALTYGQATESDFTDERAGEPVLVHLRGLSSIQAGSNLAWPEAIVEIDTRSLGLLKAHVNLQERTATAKAKWQTVAAKFEQVSNGRLHSDVARRLQRAVQAMEHADNVSGMLF